VTPCFPVQICLLPDYTSLHPRGQSLWNCDLFSVFQLFGNSEAMNRRFQAFTVTVWNEILSGDKPCENCISRPIHFFRRLFSSPRIYVPALTPIGGHKEPRSWKQPIAREDWVSESSKPLKYTRTAGVVCCQAATVSTTAIKHQYWVQHE
jgi:hypothetical protein